MRIPLSWLNDFVDIKISPEELAHRLTMSGLEVESVEACEGDTVLDVNVTANRGDCLSIIGMARETAAVLGSKLKKAHDKHVKAAKGGIKAKDFVDVVIKDKKNCGRYAAMVVDGIKIGPSPEHIVKRLNASGIRSINNVVDATNYLMIETGQPFHAFDHRNIRGKKIIVDKASDGMTFKTLDEIDRKLTSTDLMISDAEGPIAIAGVMGGMNSGVKDDTTTVVLESAYFLPTSVRKTSKRLGLSSESSRRFERFVDPNFTITSLERLAELIVELAGGTMSSDHIDIYSTPVKEKKVKFDVKEAELLLGVTLKDAECKRYLASLGVTLTDGVCTVPTYRQDLERPVDLIEEVARLHGYDKIPTTLPKISMSSVIKPEGFDLRDKARGFLSDRGFYEAVNYGFVSPAESSMFFKDHNVEVSNPLGIEFSVMKPTLLAGLLGNLKLNLSMGQDSVRLFELRPVFKSKGKDVVEFRKLAGIIYGLKRSLQWAVSSSNVDFYDAKGVCEALLKRLGISDVDHTEAADIGFMHPSASAQIVCGGRMAGFVGQIHPEVALKWDIKDDVFAFELDFDVLSKESLKRKPRFKELERFPVVRRDIALLLDETLTSKDVKDTIMSLKDPIVKDSFPFDVYKGKGIPEGKKSVAFAVFYYNPARTLTDEEINRSHMGIVSHLKEKLRAETR